MKRIKYTANMPRLLYTFFLGYQGTGAPSLDKFAISIGATLEDVTRFREHSEFERACRECSEIRRDYLIDNALTRRFDPSLVKFLLSTEYLMGEDSIKDEDKRIDFRLEVIEN